MNNRDLLLAVCREIEPLLNQFILVGGCVTELLVSDPTTPKPRMTQDVDWVVNAISLGDY
jgi:tRNA nucleotidyltransferase/poly(A) polymerase